MGIIVNVFNDSSFKRLPKIKVVSVIKYALTQEKVKNALVNIIFVDDSRIHELNKEYLNHDFATDVLAFSLSENNKVLEGEIYICAETAINQAKEYNVSITNEIMRLGVHGALHLAGYEDNTKAKKELMRKLEDKYIDFLYK